MNNMTIICKCLIESSILSDFLSLIIPFFLGLMSSFFIDYFRKNQKNKRNRNFIRMYLNNTILIELIKVGKGYSLVKDKISIIDMKYFELPAYESFNANVLNGIDSVEYFQLFKSKYVLLNEIITMIEYLSSNLPSDIYGDYWNYVENHLNEIGKMGDIHHVEKCPKCQIRKQCVLNVLDMRIKEIDSLKNKINELLNS